MLLDNWNKDRWMNLLLMETQIDNWNKDRWMNFLLMETQINLLKMLMNLKI